MKDLARMGRGELLEEIERLRSQLHDIHTSDPAILVQDLYAVKENYEVLKLKYEQLLKVKKCQL